MNWLENPEFASVIRIAAVVVIDALLDLFEDHGLSQQDAHDVLLAIRRIPVALESDEDLGQFCQSLAESLAASAERKDVLAQRIKAAELIEGTGNDGAGKYGDTLSWGSEAAKVILALSFFLLVAKSELTVDLPFAKLQIHAGIPAGFVQTVESVAKVIDAALGSKGEPPDGSLGGGHPTPGIGHNSGDEAAAPPSDETDPPGDPALTAQKRRAGQDTEHL